MTTGRINQIPSSWRTAPAGGVTPPRLDVPPTWPPGGPACSYRYVTWKGRPGGARPQRQRPAYRVRTGDHPIAHTVKPSNEALRSQGIPPGVPPAKGAGGLRHRVALWGTPPRGDAGERRMPRGGCPPESSENDGQRPATHRPHRSRARKAPGIRSPEPPPGRGGIAGGRLPP